MSHHQLSQLAKTTNNKVFRIGIDCRLGGEKNAGIGRYISNLVTQLLSFDTPQIQWVLFFIDQNQAEEMLASKHSNCEVIIAPHRHYSLAEQLQMPTIFAAAKLDLLHIPHFNVPLFYRQPFVATIHDLLWHQQKGAAVTTLSPIKYWLKYFFYHLTVKHAVDQAKIIFVPAKTMANIVTHFYPYVSTKILVTKEGIDPNFFLKNNFDDNEQKQLKKSSTTPTLKIVFTGSLYPHKNIEIVLQTLVTHTELELLIVGARSAFLTQTQKRCQELKISERVKFLGKLSDQDLIKLYQQVDVLVQPSLSEGFGLTGLEALAVGLPIAISDIPIFREVYRDCAYFFNPHNTEEVYTAILQAHANRKSLIAKAKNLLPKYNWRVMAKTIWRSYWQLLQK